MILHRMIPHDVEFPLVSTVSKFSYLDIAPNEVAFEFKPFGYELFEMVCHVSLNPQNGKDELLGMARRALYLIGLILLFDLELVFNVFYRLF